MGGTPDSTTFVFSSYFHSPLPITISLPPTTLLAVTENSSGLPGTGEKRYPFTSSWQGLVLSSQTECPRHTPAIVDLASCASVLGPRFCPGRPQPAPNVSKDMHTNFVSVISALVSTRIPNDFDPHVPLPRTVKLAKK